jgi:hypothetical protein
MPSAPISFAKDLAGELYAYAASCHGTIPSIDPETFSMETNPISTYPTPFQYFDRAKQSHLGVPDSEVPAVQIGPATPGWFDRF